MVVESEQGLYCPEGAFHLDPFLPVERAVLTHAHGDHARPGSASYLCTPQTAALLHRRLEGAHIETLRYGERRTIGGVTLSLHPAGHMLGSAQVRIEGRSGVWVLSGDYKREADPPCAPSEPLRCDVFITEATYALPLFRWDEPASVAREIVAWWQGNTKETSVLFCYALGKAQRERGRSTRRTGIARRWCVTCGSSRRSRPLPSAPWSPPIRRGTDPLAPLRCPLRCPRLDHFDEREGGGDAGLLRRGARRGRRLGTVFPHRRTAEAADRAEASRRLGLRARTCPGLAVRGVVRRRRRSRGNDRAARGYRAQWPDREPCAAAALSPDRGPAPAPAGRYGRGEAKRGVGALGGPGPPRDLPSRQAAHRRDAGRRFRDARHPRPRSARRIAARDRRSSADGLMAAVGRRICRAGRAGGGLGGRLAALSVLSRLPARGRSRDTGRSRGMARRMEVGRHPRPDRPPVGWRLSLVARRGADH